MSHPFAIMSPLEEMFLVAMSTNDDTTIVHFLDIGLGWDDWTFDTRHYILRHTKYLALFFAFGYTVDTRQAMDRIMNDPCRVRSLAQQIKCSNVVMSQHLVRRTVLLALI